MSAPKLPREESFSGMPSTFRNGAESEIRPVGAMGAAEHSSVREREGR
jgi:hypothetical protein